MAPDLRRGFAQPHVDDALLRFVDGVPVGNERAIVHA
jgi:hypothetical protein